MLHIVNNLAVPVSFGSAKSYSLFSGVQDAMTQWWYGHNAVAFFLTAGFLGMMYYYLPKRAGRPLFSYRMSIISFWGITFLYMWAGSHHLHYTALPQWVQTLGMTFSVMLLVPSWSAAANALLTLNGAWHKVRDDATLRFMMVAAVFYGLTTFEGSFLAIRSVNALSHYTDWTVGHVHAGALGWVAMITFGSIYASVPWLWKREAMYSARLVEVHFWLALAGHHRLRDRDVELRHHPGADVADLQRQRHARLFVRRFAGRDAPLLHRPRGRRPAVPDRRAGRLLQHLDDGARRAAARRRRAAERLSRAGGCRRPPARRRSRSHVRTPLLARTQGDRLCAGHHRRRQHRRRWSRSRRCSPSTRPSRTRPTCGSTPRSSWPAATSTSAKAATPAIRR